MQLTFDMFSGRPNPSWRLPSAIATVVFDLIVDNDLVRAQTSDTFSSALGYRGMKITLPTDLFMKYRLPPALSFSVDHADHLPVFRELAALTLMPAFFAFPDLHKFVQMIYDLLRGTKTVAAPPAKPPPAAAPGAPTPCAFEMLKFDPAPWNDPAFQPTNNCYAYATNKRAAYASKPQPGLASGAIFASLSGTDVAAAAKRDGAHEVNDCFPDSEKPRMLVALVIWPGNDYHWYRKQTDCWGHKPGGTPARNVDESGVVITDPEKCDRGPYTDFIRYMLIPNSQKVAAA
jgi:hypothetical protein